MGETTEKIPPWQASGTTMKPPLHKVTYYATHRVLKHNPAIWQQYNSVTEQWEQVTYDDVPDKIWAVGSQDEWRFYTDRKHVAVDAEGKRHARDTT
jgi:hypothetical protein